MNTETQILNNWQELGAVFTWHPTTPLDVLLPVGGFTSEQVDELRADKPAIVAALRQRLIADWAAGDVVLEGVLAGLSDDDLEFVGERLAIRELEGDPAPASGWHAVGDLRRSQAKGMSDAKH